MSNKIKNKQNLKKIERPAKASFFCYLGDHQGCGTIRVIYPYLLLNNYREEGLYVDMEYGMHLNFDPNFYKHFMLVQFQRACTSGHYKVFEHFVDVISPTTKTFIVYEIDDLLFDIPEWNFAHDYYKDKKNYIINMMAKSQGMIVSTPKLKQVYGKYNGNIKVIPNHLPKFIWGDIFEAHEYKNENEKIRILWAGSQNHFALKNTNRNGGDFGPELINFIKKTTDKYQWVLMGGYPLEIEDEIKSGKIEFHNWMSTFEYPQFVKSLEPDICIAPLQKSLFNDCKSNIKSLEFAALGAPGVYSNVIPYKDMSLIGNSEEEFISHVEKLANDIDYRSKIWYKDYSKIKNQLWWEKNNNLKEYINTYLSLFGKKL